MESQELTSRCRQVLSIVVQEYTQSAQPVSSNTITKYGLGVSAATIRNDMAALERAGLLIQPHTSAGRIPTDAGYRYFVHHLLSDKGELNLAEQRTIRREFRHMRQEMDQWLRLSTSILARTSQIAALATAPRSAQCHFKHIELVGIQDTKVLVVLVLQAGTVKQQLLDLDEPMDQDELRKISNELNHHLGGLGLDAISQTFSDLSVFACEIALLVVKIMQRLDNHIGGHIYRDGLSLILESPEFAGNNSIQNLVRVFEERTLLQQVVEQYNDDGYHITSSEDDQVHVMIAGDGLFAELAETSLILGRYGVLDQATGVLGVIGPLRMSYARNISAVRFVATLMSEIVEEMYGS